MRTSPWDLRFNLHFALDFSDEFAFCLGICGSICSLPWDLHVNLHFAWGFAANTHFASFSGTKFTVPNPIRGRNLRAFHELASYFTGFALFRLVFYTLFAHSLRILRALR